MTLINIDHHMTNDNYGHINHVDPHASSTAEVIYELLKAAGTPLNKTMAIQLYMGMMTDTGSFRFENTSARTHQIAGELLKYKFSADTLYRNFYDNIPLKDVTQLTKLLSNFQSHLGGKVISISLRKHDLRKFSEKFDLRDSIFRYLRAIQEGEVFVIFTELSTKSTRVNFRSSGFMNVARLAKYFQGGGHRKASGCTLDQPINKAQKDVLKEIKRVLSYEKRNTSH